MTDVLEKAARRISCAGMLYQIGRMNHALKPLAIYTKQTVINNKYLICNT